MEIKNLLDKLHNAQEGGENAIQPQVNAQVQQQQMPPPQFLQIPRPGAMPMPAPEIQERIKIGPPAEKRGAFKMMPPHDNEGIILDLGEGISLNIPIRKRMSLSDFLRIAEKVKALELLGEEAQQRENNMM